MDENCTPLWKFKIPTQNLDNKISTTNGMETQNKLNNRNNNKEVGHFLREKPKR